MVTTNLIVTPDWLYAHLDDPHVAVIDCRFVLGNPDQGRLAYESGHIPGALYMDLERDLSAPKQEHGGRHPLPSVEAMTKLFSRAGIDEQVTVVAYDDQDMAMAARLWWMLRYLGHEKVVVLDGGFAGWQKAGYPYMSEVIPRDPRTFTPRVQSQMLVQLDEVLARDKDTVLIDSRAKERYLGEVETIDPKAGHIPGAVNYFFKENLAADGTLLPASALQERFIRLNQAPEVIVYCGSGVTACVNLLALHQAGRTDAKLYLGSWSDYCTYDLPVAKKEE